MRSNNSLKLSEVRPGLPSLAESAACAAKLREAMFDGVTQNDITEIMKSFVAKAKAGDAKAAKLVFDVVAQSAPKTTFSVGMRAGQNVIDHAPVNQSVGLTVAIAGVLGTRGPMSPEEIAELVGCHDQDEFEFAIESMTESGYVDHKAGAGQIRLTSAGRKQLVG